MSGGNIFSVSRNCAAQGVFHKPPRLQLWPLRHHQKHQDFSPEKAEGSSFSQGASTAIFIPGAMGLAGILNNDKIVFCCKRGDLIHGGNLTK